jgi:hypothetical protein
MSSLLNRADFDRYVALFNAADPRFADFYADDISFLTFLKGKEAVLDFYARQRPYVREKLVPVFFCADADGAAAEVQGEFRCIKDCDDPAVFFGATPKAGQVQRTHGYLLYVLDSEGKIAEIKGPPPEIVQPWHG